MATFKVGQRVRIVGGPDLAYNHIKQGKTATIVKPALFDRNCWCLDIDGLGRAHPDGTLYGAMSHHLAPLTDPRADEFIERVKGWGPLDEPNEDFVKQVIAERKRRLALDVRKLREALGL